MLYLLGSVFLGWSLGANDAANAFGSAVASRMLKFQTAALLAAGFVVIGALLEGRAGIQTLQGLTRFSLEMAVVSSVAAAVTVTVMTLVGLPVSTSQAVVGTILAIGVLNRHLDYGGLSKVVACWFGTPLGGMVAAVGLYKLLAYLYNRLPLDLFQSDILLRGALILAGSYAAYALGANNVANVTAVFVGAGRLDFFSAALLGGISIGLGILTFSRRVMETVGRRLVRLDPFSALIVVLAEGLTVHFYTLVGVPVSTSQAVVGAVLGVGLVKGIKTVSLKTLTQIVLAWFLTPAIACAMALAIYFISNLRFMPSF